MYFADFKPKVVPADEMVAQTRQLGALVPGISDDTMRMVIYGSLGLVGLSVAMFFILRDPKKGAAYVPAKA
jgi:hypothetical protein